MSELGKTGRQGFSRCLPHPPEGAEINNDQDCSGLRLGCI